MWTSQCDLENSKRNKHVVLWVTIAGIVIGTYLAFAV